MLSFEHYILLSKLITTANIPMSVVIGVSFLNIEKMIRRLTILEPNFLDNKSCIYPEDDEY